MLEKISKTLAFVGIGSLFFRRGIFHPYILQPFEILILISFLFLIVHFIKNGVEEKIKKELLCWGKRLSLFLFLFGLGLIFAILSYKIDAEIVVGILRDYFILFSNSLVFLLIIYFKNSSSFVQKSLKSFLIPLIFGIFILFPALILLINVTEGYGSLFIGFHNSRTAFGNFLIVPLSILWAYFLKNQNTYKKIISWIGLVIIIALMLWTSARNAYLAIILIPSFIFLISILEKKKILWFSKFILLSITSVLLAYIILPQRARNTVIFRIFPQYANLSNLSSFSDKELKQIGITKKSFTSTQKANVLFNKKNLVTVPSISNQDLMMLVLKNPYPKININSRIEIWKKTIPLFFKNPFGLSTQFYNISKKINDETNGIHIAGSHNTFLQIGLSAGWVGLLLFFFFLYKILLSLKNSRDPSWEWLALASANFGMLLMFLFDDRLFDPWVWIVMSLALIYSNSKENKQIKNPQI